MSWGWGHADNGRENSERCLCFLLAQALPVLAPDQGTDLVLVPNPSTASPYPWLVFEACQELHSLK